MLENAHPIGQHPVSHTLPDALRDKLPSIESIGQELGLNGLNADSSD
jgi:hypothetical protein